MRNLPLRPRPILAAACAAALLSACGPTAVDPATLPTPFSFTVANPDSTTGAVFTAVYEAFGEFPTTSSAIGVSELAISDASPGATITAAGAVSGTLRAVADIDRVNEAFGFLMGFERIFFVPEGCDVTTTNAGEAAFAMPPWQFVWDGVTVEANGIPSTITGQLDLRTIAGDVQTIYILVASRSAWSAETTAPCTAGSDTLELDLAANVGWQFLRATVTVGPSGDTIVLETLTLDEVAALGPIGELSDVGIGSATAPRLTPIYR